VHCDIIDFENGTERNEIEPSQLAIDFSARINLTATRDGEMLCAASSEDVYGFHLAIFDQATPGWFEGMTVGWVGDLSSEEQEECKQDFPVDECEVGEHSEGMQKYAGFETRLYYGGFFLRNDSGEALPEGALDGFMQSRVSCFDPDAYEISETPAGLPCIELEEGELSCDEL
jgi:hypothetical protein